MIATSVLTLALTWYRSLNGYKGCGSIPTLLCSLSCPTLNITPTAHSFFTTKVTCLLLRSYANKEVCLTVSKQGSVFDS